MSRAKARHNDLLRLWTLQDEYKDMTVPHEAYV